MQTLLRPFDILLVSKKPPTVLDSLYRNSPVSDDGAHNCVYEISCSDCDATYIGETSVSLHSRLLQHELAIRKSDLNNGPAAHIAAMQSLFGAVHTINVEGTVVLDRSDDIRILRHLESMWIDIRQPTMNQKFEVNLHPCIIDFLKFYLHIV